MQTVSVSCPTSIGTFSPIIDVRGLDPASILVKLSKELGVNDTVTIYGTLDSSASSTSVNLTQINTLAGNNGNALNGLDVSGWPFLFAVRTGGSSGGGNVIASGIPNAAGNGASVTPPNVALPAANAYSALIDLAPLGSVTFRVGLSANQTAKDTFLLFGTNDATAGTTQGSASGQALGFLTGGDGTTGTLVISAPFRYLFVQRLTGSTSGSAIVWGASTTSSNGAAANQVVYRQGDVTNVAAGIYGAFPAAFAAWVAVPNGNMVVDGSIAQPFVPAGNYPFPIKNLTMTALYFETLNIQDGAHFTTPSGLNITLDGVDLNNQCTTAPPFVSSSGAFFIQVKNGGYLGSDPAATQPLASLTSGGSGVITLDNSSTINGDPAAVIFAVAAGAELQVDASTYSTITDHSFSGAGAFTVIIEDNSVNYSQTQPGVTGSIEWDVWGGTYATRVSASNTSGQSIPNNTPTVITNWTAATNVSPLSAGSFNAATGVFTAPLAGWYQVTGRVTIAPGTGTFKTDILHNTTVVDEDLVVTASTPSQPITMSVAFAFECSVGDTISLRTSQTSGGALLLNEGGGAVTFSISFGN